MITPNCFIDSLPAMKILRKIVFSILLPAFLLIFLLADNRSVLAQTPQPNQPVYIYLFWGEGCPHCAKAKPFLEKLAAKYPGVVLKEIEIYNSEENQALFYRMAEKFGIQQLGVPLIFIGPYHLLGYIEDMDPQIEAVVLECIQKGCIDPASILAAMPAETTQATPAAPPPLVTTPETSITSPSNSETNSANYSTAGALVPQSNQLEIPLLGKVDLSSHSALLSTALIALVDGFNPCSLWVLTMLMALTLHTGSRRKVFLIGIIFLTVTSLIYALFITGLFSLLTFVGFMGWARIAVCLVALFFAVVNIKDYFWYKEGLSFSIADGQKPGIFKRMRAVVNASQSPWGMAAATIILAAGVSLVEFSCTAGLPVMWVNLLSAQNVGTTAFILLLLVYMLIYQLDEMVIFFSSVATLKASRLEEKHGRLLKLISGMLMLTLALVMLINPALMNSIGSSLAIFGLSLAATLLILLIQFLAIRMKKAEQ